jgi:hypothetical protein
MDITGAGAYLRQFFGRVRVAAALSIACHFGHDRLEFGIAERPGPTPSG